MALTITSRHGGGSHYVRPDRVAYTSVTESIYGYDPTADVQDVAAAMTQGRLGPAQLAGAMLYGPGLSTWQKIKIKLAAAKARRQVKKMAKAAGMQGLGVHQLRQLNGLRGLRDAQSGFVDQGEGWGAGVAQNRMEAMAAQVTNNFGPAPQSMRQMAFNVYDGAGFPGQITQQAVSALPSGGPNQIQARAYGAAANIFTTPTTWRGGGR